MAGKPERRRFETPDSVSGSAEVMSPQTWVGMVWVAMAVMLGYAVVGFAGITLQSAQTGVTPVWPASGVAFGLCYWFGIRFAVLIIPAMLGLAWVLGVPLSVAALAGVGSMLEAAVGVWLLRHYRVDPALTDLRDTLLFIAVAVVLGPVFSASLGTLAMALLTENPIPSLYIWLMWWLGNSLGVLVIGGLSLVSPGLKAFPRRGSQWLELAALCAFALLATWLSISQIEHVSSALVMYLLIPVLVFAALWLGQFGVLMVAAVVLLTLLAANHYLPHDNLGLDGLGVLYLDITLLWVAGFTGLIVGSARQEHRQLEEVSWLATHDAVTDLANRHRFAQHLERALGTVREQHLQHAVVYIDLDRFKRINDAEGHVAGDRVLRDVADILIAEVRRRDTVARMGGDKFGLLLESCPLVEACGIAENVRRALENYSYRGVHGDYAVEASIGVVEVADGSINSGTVLQQADVACREAKRAGRNRVWVGQVKVDGKD